MIGKKAREKYLLVHYKIIPDSSIFFPRSIWASSTSWWA